MVVCRRPPSAMAVCRRPPSAMAVCRRPHRHHSSDHFNKVLIPSFLVVLDSRCWMLLAADCMHSNTEQLMQYDKDYGAYFDYGNHTEKVRLRQKLVEKNGNQPNLELVREVLEKPELRLVPHIGYVSL
ncbi:mannosyl-oligosaccharide glucosidase GCS1 [Tanacetum coccineum]|uniref:Mannosyl-oligosaccharide glucosidase GCS1 n=1 Tax=Tanacetum coccineum TaxID=301880 RepID=A0ABQ4YBY1_9ASTR